MQMAIVYIIHCRIICDLSDDKMLWMLESNWSIPIRSIPSRHNTSVCAVRIELRTHAIRAIRPSPWWYVQQYGRLLVSFGNSSFSCITRMY